MALVGFDKKADPLHIDQGAALGYCSGFVWYLGNCYWVFATMYRYGGLAKPIAAGILVLFCLYLGLYHALFGGLIACFSRGFGRQWALFLSPFVWVAVELARARITGLPWDMLGVAQVDNFLLTRLSPYAGAYGLSFVIAAVNALWLVRVRVKERRYTRTVMTVVGVATVVLYVAFLRRMEAPRSGATSAVATLVQENLEVGAANVGPQLSKREMLRRFAELSVHPGRAHCYGIPELASTLCGVTKIEQLILAPGEMPPPNPTDLIVWPESPAPFEESDPDFREAMSGLAREAKAPVIVGNIGIDLDEAVKRGYDLHNSAEFIAPDGSFVGRYDKMHLVPFGEYTPFKRILFFAGSLLQNVGLFDPGIRRSLFDVGRHKFGTFICYESIFADEIRQYENLGADVLVNISDDGWYGDTSAAWEHLNMVRMRAIENHRWVLRATNTGVTAAIDPYGRVVMAVPRHVQTSLRVGFDYEKDITFYAKYGDLFAYLCALVTLGGMGISTFGGWHDYET